MKNALLLVLVVVFLIGLGWAWPHLAASARNPVMGDWDPKRDLGTQLVLVHGTCTETYSLGHDHNAIDLVSKGPKGFVGAQSIVYLEADGVLGHDGERQKSQHDTTLGAPDLTSDFALTGGYRDRGHLRAVVRHEGGAESVVTVGPPIDLTGGTTHDWQPLVVVWHLGAMLEWRTTAEHLQIRRSHRPGATPRPTWGGGHLRLGDATGSFGSSGAGEQAGVPRAAATWATAAETRTVVEVALAPDGQVWTTVTVH